MIERPASVVKELVENAIDAGSGSVTVEIKEGGISYMRIADNGCGIARDDVQNAFLRHSTSKIRAAEDLEHIASLGFRGEALSSIAAVYTGRDDYKNKGTASWNALPDRRWERRRTGRYRSFGWNNISDP